MGAASSDGREAQGACRAFKHKMLYIVGDEPDPVASAIGGQCWCAHTQSSIGPDDQLVVPEHCGPGRACFERTG